MVRANSPVPPDRRGHAASECPSRNLLRTSPVEEVVQF
ncbi:hypothetical protein RISK_003529 [Rhodopirellula islandica]|uniref:Uncharacterized protein n=1 Tax=Rhodopirellula islandica TaxID=595434 RepID=A0A0J1BD01_RHOIS|nr:hypothetical protein RISK_003529 [Rhodopirellula islandica]